MNALTAYRPYVMAERAVLAHLDAIIGQLGLETLRCLASALNHDVAAEGAQ